MEQLTGALAGWKRTRTTSGIVLSFQVAASVEDLHQRRLSRVDLALNDRQLRSLARDLIRAAEQRDLDIFARPRWWTRLFSRRVRSVP